MCPSKWLARLLGYFLGPLLLWTLGLPKDAEGVLEHGENMLGREILCQPQSLGQHWVKVVWALTSADALLLPRQDAGAVNDADTLQDLIGQLGAHESGRKRAKVGSETSLQSVLMTKLLGLSGLLTSCAVNGAGGGLQGIDGTSTGTAAHGAGMGGALAPAVICHQIPYCPL